MAEALPSVITKSSTSTSFPAAGKRSPRRMRSGLISPTTRTDFTSGPPVDLEALHDPADDAIVGGGVRTQAGSHAAEEGEDLPHEDVEEGGIVVVLRPQPGDVDHEVVRDVGPHQHLARTEALAIQLADQVGLVGADHLVGGEEADDERFLVDRG